MTLATRPLRIRLQTPAGAALAGAKVTLQLSAYQVDGTDIVPLAWDAIEDPAKVGDYLLDVWPNTRGDGGTHYDTLVQANGQVLLRQVITVPAGAGESLVAAKINAAPWPPLYAASSEVQASRLFSESAGQSASRALAAKDVVIPVAQQFGDVAGIVADVTAKRDQTADLRGLAADDAASASAAATTAVNSLAAALAAGNTKTSIAIGLAAAAVGDVFWVRPGGVDALKVFTSFLKTGPSNYQRLQVLPDGTAFAVEPGEPLHVFRSDDDWDFAFFNALGELLLSGLGGRSVQELLLEIGRQLYAAKVSPHLFVIQDSDETEVAWVERDGRLMLPLTGGVALQDWVRVAVEALVKGNPAAPFEVTVGDVGAFALRYDGEVEIPNLDGRTLQEVLRDVEGKLGGMANLSLSPSALPLGDNTSAVLVRNMADPLYAPAARAYVAIPSVVKAGGRLWCAYTASRSVAVNSGEEPGSFCVVAISEDDGQNWSEILVIAHPLSTGRVADPTLSVRGGWHGALSICYFQSGSNVAYDEAVSTWEIVCDNPAADPSVMAWTKPAKLAYGMFVTSPARVGGADLVPVFVIGDTLASAHVKRQHLNLNRGVDIYRRFEGALLPFSRIPYDGPRSGWSWLEPSIQQCPDGSLLALVRYADGLYFQRSLDGGTTWGVRASITAAPGIDATVSAKGSLTTTSRGHLCLVWNNATARSALSIALSSDGGETWTSKVLLSGAWLEVSYPSVCHEGDAIHVVFDRDRVALRRIYHVKLSLAALLTGTQLVSPTLVNLP